MSLECVAGKNPVTHVGKLYNLLASEIAAEIADRIDEVEEAECVLLSRIGRPVSDPPVVRVALSCAGARPPAGLDAGCEAVVRRHLARAGSLWRDLLSGELALDRWPLRTRGAGGAPAPPAVRGAL
jgi:S-adenosylmethionine synthetase